MDDTPERRDDDEAAQATQSKLVTAPKRLAGGVLGFVEAIGLGVKDTASDVLRAGREGAAESYDDMWARYEAKTKHRRKRKDGDS